MAYANLPKQGRKKLDDRAVKYILVRYASQTKGYRLWCPNKSDVIVTKHVRFAEDKIGYEWLYKDNTLHKYRHNDFWSESDSESESDHNSMYKPKEVREDLQSASEDSTEDLTTEQENSNERHKKVGEEIESRKRKAGRPKKVIRNPYG